MKIILTGATGMVGEGVLLECLANPLVSRVLMVNRKPSPHQHPKLHELLAPDFNQLAAHTAALAGYDACFYCAGISSAGMSEAAYMQVTFTTTLNVAKAVAATNPNMVFNFISGVYTDSSEKGWMMWARVKGKTENALVKLPFKGVYNFRPGFMKPTPGQQNVRLLFKLLTLIYPYVFPRKTLTFQQIGRAMLQTTAAGYARHVLEIADIKKLAALEGNGPPHY
jgi:uncharacterized protein YbjT (DUF2867 family)